MKTEIELLDILDEVHNETLINEYIQAMSRYKRLYQCNVIDGETFEKLNEIEYEIYSNAFIQKLVKKTMTEEMFRELEKKVKFI